MNSIPSNPDAASVTASAVDRLIEHAETGVDPVKQAPARLYPCPVCGSADAPVVPGYMVQLCPPCREAEQAALEGRISAMNKVLDHVAGAVTQARQRHTFKPWPGHVYAERSDAGSLFRIVPEAALDNFSRDEALTLHRELGELLACPGCEKVADQMRDGLCPRCNRNREADQ